MRAGKRLLKISSLGLGIVIAVGGCSNAPANGGPKISGTGPLGGQEDKTAYLLPNDVGAQFTDGFAVLQLSGEEPATIVKIESIGGKSTFKFLGAKISGPGREITTQQALPGWPAKGFGPKVLDAAGLKIKPLRQTLNEDGYEILMGYQRISTKPAVRRGIRITYTIGDKTYRAVLPSAFASCSTQQADDTCLSDAFARAGA